MTDIRRLPTPLTALWDWQVQGACRELSSELFFHPDSEREPLRSAREAAAKRICRQCPVLTRCREYSLLVREPYGVWGGLSVAERAAVLSGRRDPARPADGGRAGTGGITEL